MYEIFFPSADQWGQVHAKLLQVMTQNMYQGWQYRSRGQGTYITTTQAEVDQLVKQTADALRLSYLTGGDIPPPGPDSIIDMIL